MPLIVNGWTLLFHDLMVGQVRALADATRRARIADPEGWRSNANAKVLGSVARLVLRSISENPGRPEHRIGNTMGPDYRHWARARFGGRFRLFFRYDGRAKIIVFAWVFAWVNDEGTLRCRGSRTDPYSVFRAMLERGIPPDDWSALLAAAETPPDPLFGDIADPPP